MRGCDRCSAAWFYLRALCRRAGEGPDDGPIDLVGAVLDWAAAAGARTVGLWVTRGNDRALRFYERAGFTVTGDVQPLPSDPCKDEIRMVLQLREATADR